MIQNAIAILAIAAAAVVITRAICTLHGLHWRHTGLAYPRFLSLGLSHVALATGALLVALDVLHGTASLAAIAAVLGAAGLGLFDRRKGR